MRPSVSESLLSLPVVLQEWPNLGARPMKFPLRCKASSQYLDFAFSTRLGILKCLSPVLCCLWSLWSVKQRLQLVHGGAELIRVTKRIE